MKKNYSYRTKQMIGALVVIVLALGLTAGSAQAQVYRINYEGTGNWDVAANWHIYDYQPNPLVYFGPAGHAPVVPIGTDVTDGRIFIGGHANMTTPKAADVTVSADLGAADIGEDLRVGVDSKLTIPVGRTVTTGRDLLIQNGGASIDVSGTVITGRDFRSNGAGTTVNISGSVTAERDFRVNDPSAVEISGSVTVNTRRFHLNDNGAVTTIKTGGTVVAPEWRIQGTLIMDNSAGLIGPLTCEGPYRDDGGTMNIMFIAGAAGVSPINVSSTLNFDNNGGDQSLIVNVLNFSGTELILFNHGGALTGQFTDVTVIGGSATVEYTGTQIKLTNIALDTTAPSITDVGPEAGSTVIGSITHISVNFDEPMAPLAAGDLTVDGTTATAVTDLGIPNGGPFLFEVPTITDLGVHNVVLDTTNVKDLSGNAVTTGGDTWTVTLALTPPLIYYDGFGYTAGQSLEDQANWFLGGANPTGPHLDILSDSSLTYTAFAGLPPSTGGRLRMSPEAGGSNATVETRFDNVLVGEGQSLYFSFLYKPVTGTHADTYFSLVRIGEAIDRDNDARGRFAGELNRVAEAPKHSLEIRFRNAAGRALFAPIGIDETVLLVGKLTSVPGPDNDIFEAYVNPDPTAAEPATADYTATGAPGEDIDPSEGFVGFTIRARPNSGDFEYDELRIATTWAAAMGDVKTPPQLSSRNPVILPDVLLSVGDTSSETFNISNSGTETLTITSATISSGEGFTLLQPVSAAFPISLGLAESTVFLIGYDFKLVSNPSSAIGVNNGTLSITSNSVLGPVADIGVQVEVRLGADPAAAQNWMLYDSNWMMKEE